ncbi:MAG: hypothetical protein ACYTKC_17020 [Planctomycetota bacterium]|jgi:hypothetical protein
MMLRFEISSLAVLTFVTAASVSAQAPTFVYSPAGAELMTGGSSNTVPFWSRSATYQQIHDHDDMVRAGGGKPILMKAIGLRPFQNATLTGRSWELQLNVGITTVDSQNISTTFAANLGSKPTRVVGDLTTPFQKVSFSTFTGSGNPTKPGVILPFRSTYICIPVKGNHFCWEWRHRNASLISFMSVDAIQGTAHRGLIKPSVGAGCSGATASAGFVLSRVITNFKASLASAPASAKALMMVGVQRKKTVLGGWCSSLETVPLVHVFGSTDFFGRWDFIAPLTAFKGTSTFELLIQYAFADNNQPFGVGLSNMAVYQTPLPGGYNMSRAYRSKASGSFNGDEQATTAQSITKSYGLVVGFQQ